MGSQIRRSELVRAVHQVKVAYKRLSLSELKPLRHLQSNVQDALVKFS